MYHLGVYNPQNPEPYELSRYRIENFILRRELISLIKFPSIPGYSP